MIERKSPGYNHDSYKIPFLELIVHGENAVITAEVFASNMQERYGFLRSNEADSAEKALFSLLEVTMVVLSKERSKNIANRSDCIWVPIGPGSLHMPVV